MTVSEVLAAFAAGFGGGLVNAIAGGGTLITFPVLVALGLDPKVANATSNTALLPSFVSAAWGYRAHLGGTRTRVLRLGVPCVIGSVFGAMLLLHTPSSLFARFVPWLILFATVLFAAGEALVKVARRGASPDGRACTGVVAAAMLVVGGYGGYFGAGLGILTLAALGLLGESDIHRANGVKNLLGACVNGVAAVTFVAAALVSWPHAFATACGGVAGAWVSATVAQRLDRRVVRGLIVAIGLILGLSML